LVPYPVLSAELTSASMEPTVLCANPSDRYCTGKNADLLLLALSGARSLRRGDLVSFRLPGAASRYCDLGDAVKRVIGLPGDHVVERHGLISVDGHRLSEPYVPADERDDRSGSWRVPRGSLFVMGDDRKISCDSRYWGPVSESRVLGRVIAIFRDGRQGRDPVGPPIVHAGYAFTGDTDLIGEMVPTVRCVHHAQLPQCNARSNDLALVERSGARSIRRGATIEFRTPEAGAKYCGPGYSLQRVIGLAGDSVVEKHGTVFVDGHRLIEPYVLPWARGHLSGTWHVPAHSLFVMADYRISSCGDSRLWGPLPDSLVLGRVTEIFRSKS
jgi:signal peptidase I